MLIILVIFPLLSLRSGGQPISEKEVLKRENDTIRQEIKLLSDEIKVVEDQIRYKDSLDNARLDSLHRTR